MKINGRFVLITERSAVGKEKVEGKAEKGKFKLRKLQYGIQPFGFGMVWNKVN